MNEENRKNVLPISGFLLLLAALGFFQFAELPFVGSRPQVPEIHEPSEKTKARLWQDPFRAVLAYPKEDSVLTGSGRFGLLDASKDSMAADNSLQNQISKNANNGRVTVLGVMVFGAPYAEETEDRVRRRHAVLTALGKAGYVPDDPEHIDFIRTGGSTGQNSMSNIMPFEWLSRSETNGTSSEDSVLILWINDDELKDEPLPILGRLVDCLTLKKEENKLKNHVAWKIIGPAGSTRLEEMLKNLKGYDTNESEALDKESIDKLKGIEIYSATATMDDALLLETIGEEAADHPRQNALTISAKFDNKDLDDFDINLTRTIASDGELAGKLFDELKLRGVVLNGKSDDYIMLVAEWDTVYARSLLRIYREVFEEEGMPRHKLIGFHYMRGIDGSLPGKKGEHAKEESDSVEPGDKSVKQLERPIGESQYDYLRRLAGEAYEFEQELKPKGGSIKAIGVLGSDFYDKYLVLQALRQKFPNVIFFTTDLDARLLHPDNIEWTRNLVVASSYGLTLRNEEEQGEPQEIPLSFRSNYQTSVYAATLMAFASEKPDVTEAMKPRIFEIGRRCAVDLTTGRIWDSRAALRKGGLVAAMVLSTILLLYFSSTTARNVFKTVIFSHLRLFVTVTALVLAYTGLVMYLSYSPGEEPFSLSEGVSIWPTEILRLFALFLSFYFLLYSSARLRKNNREIARDFQLAAASGEKEGESREMVDYYWDVDKKGNGADIAELWQAYRRQNSLRYRIIRLAPIIFVYASLCFLILLTFGRTVTPVRGPVSWWLDKIVLFFSVGLFIVLNFYVFDVTRTFRRFVVLARELPKWPEDLMKKFGSKEEIQEDGALEEWLLIRLIAIRTDALGKLIFYPFAIWLILFLARINYFDNWHTPPGLGIIFFLGALYAWSSAFVLRRSAERTRAITIQRLKRLLARSLTENAEESRIKQIEFALNEVKSNRQGAFAPFSQHPLLQALLIPFGGVGGLYLFELLSKMNI